MNEKAIARLMISLEEWKVSLGRDGSSSLSILSPTVQYLKKFLARNAYEYVSLGLLEHLQWGKIVGPLKYYCLII